jgi:hypothetical protein
MLILNGKMLRAASLLAVLGRAASAAGQILGGSKGDSWGGSLDEYDMQLARTPPASRLRNSTIGRRAGGSFSSVLPLTQMQDQAMPEVLSAGFVTSKAVLIDLGFYQWKPDGPLAAADGAGVDAATQAAAQQAAQGGLLHLVQVQSQRLAPRMLLFDWPLKACEGEDALLQQLLPGFLDAPGELCCEHLTCRNKAVTSCLCVVQCGRLCRICRAKVACSTAACMSSQWSHCVLS